MTNTGVDARRTTCSATLPCSMRRMPRRPCVLGPLDDRVDGIVCDLSFDVDRRVRIDRQGHFAKPLGSGFERWFWITRFGNDRNVSLDRQGQWIGHNG